MPVEFTPSAGPTLGIEWELALVGSRTRDLVPAAERVADALRRPDGSPDPRVHRELLRNTVELVTGVHRTVPDAVEDLTEALTAVQAAARSEGLDLFSAGTHPFAHSLDQEISNGQRYAVLIERTQWWGRQMLVYGVHVHVGVRCVDRVLPILNGLLAFYPHLQALSASSPFWGGADTGYASNRALMFQQLPTAGLPFQFASWPEFEGYVADMLTTGVIEGYKDIRWDVRPSPRFGTVEVRVCDGLPTLREVSALAALIHCLVVDLDEQLDAGKVPATLPPWFVQENKWRSARYGLAAEIIVDAAGRERPVVDDLMDLLTRLEPVARRLGCPAELGSVAEIPRIGASYQRQRQVAGHHGGDLRAVVDSLVRELEAGCPILG